MEQIAIRTAHREEDSQALLKIYTPYVEQTAITFEYETPTAAEFAVHNLKLTERRKNAMKKTTAKDKAANFSWKNTLTVAVMLFGLYFGAGNLIFPVYMGQQAGKNVCSAAAGFLVTGVGIPLLAIAALGNSRSSGLQQLASRVGRRYGFFFTAALYLTIGPFFAIPRCASTSFSVGILPVLQNESLTKPLQWAFSLAFLPWRCGFPYHRRTSASV